MYRWEVDSDTILGMMMCPILIKNAKQNNNFARSVRVMYDEKKNRIQQNIETQKIIIFDGLAPKTHPKFLKTMEN